MMYTMPCYILTLQEHHLNRQTPYRYFPRAPSLFLYLSFWHFDGVELIYDSESSVIVAERYGVLKPLSWYTIQGLDVPRLMQSAPAAFRSIGLPTSQPSFQVESEGRQPLLHKWIKAAIFGQSGLLIYFFLSQTMRFEERLNFLAASRARYEKTISFKCRVSRSRFL